MATTKTITGKLPNCVGATLTLKLQAVDEPGVYTPQPNEETVANVVVDAKGQYSFQVTTLTFGKFKVTCVELMLVLGTVRIFYDLAGTYQVRATNQQAQALRDDIAAIDEVLNAGVTSVTVDGTTTQFDLDSLRRRKRELQLQLSAVSGNEAAKRPVASSIFLGGFQ